MFTLRDLLHIIFKRKFVILVFFLAVLVGGFAGLKIFAPTYAATAKLMLKIGREDIYVPVVSGTTMNTPLWPMAREEQLNSEIQILTSEDLIGKLVETLTPQGIYPSMFVRHPWYTPRGLVQGLTGLYTALDAYFAPLSANPTPEQKAMKRLSRKDLLVKGTGDSHVFEVTVYSKVPEIAARTANTLVDLYLDARGRIHADAQGGIFQSELEEMEGRLTRAQEDLRQFREVHGLVDVEQEREQLLKRIAEIRSVIVDLESRPTEARRAGKWHAELKDVEASLGTLSTIELDYVRKVQDVEVLKKSREMYLDKLEEVRIDNAMTHARIGNVSVISRAVAPVSPVSPKLWLVLIAMLVIGIGGGFGLAFLQEM
ncbi:MAG TPA: GNVR domain-containing protein, partial [Alphaproteobacteria bacterium]|nr:GNVR domain-containing protein [Alphaproteobacteria bacterium]